MRKLGVIGLVVAVAGGVAVYSGMFSSGEPAAPAGPAGRQGGGGFGGFGRGGGPRVPMTVEMGKVTRGDLSAQLSSVGSLIGLQTVDVAPKTGGRLTSVSVQLGDRVRRGQVLAKIEDREILQQVAQAEASLAVAKATIRQREADLKVAELNFERSKNLFGRQLLAKQALDDAESRYMASVAQLDLSTAQLAQTDARLQELRINLQNTSVTSPVDGFVGKRSVDPGAMVSQNSAIASVVDISQLRLIVNVVEKDIRMVTVGDSGVVEVDAYPGEKFQGRIARVAPVLDPATRTASMEVEIPNGDNRLKPGMYARVVLTVEERKDTLVVPKIAVVDFESQRGVWVPNEDNRARFVPIQMGIEDVNRIEVRGGLAEGDSIVTTGATAVRNNDQLVIAGAGDPGGAARAPGAGREGGQGNFKKKGGQRPEGGQGAPGGRRGARQPPSQ
ncbi:MAG: efflux RND transporter periplasmic adaptor subunit [Acidobacteria bacterium]|nr:efflux RND transporter periplasmic adaptor subunit [Acidobacteriota bacterium]